MMEKKNFFKARWLDPWKVMIAMHEYKTELNSLQKVITYHYM